MNSSLKEIKKQALALSADEREKLGEALIASAHNQEVTEVDRKWIAVAEERYASLISGRDPGLSQSEFFTTIEERLGWR